MCPPPYTHSDWLPCVSAAWHAVCPGAISRRRAQVRLGSHGNSNEHDLALFIKYALPRMYQPCVAVPAQS